MGKAFLSIFLCAFLLPFTAVAAAGVTDFEDVNPGDWYYSAVDYATKNGLFSGTATNMFSPDDPMTRGMFVTVLGRYSGVLADNFKGEAFADVKQSDYFAPYAEWASTRNIVSGTGNNQFSPHVAVTREQIATMLYKYAAYKGGDTANIDSSKYLAFPDYKSVSDYAVEAMQWATAKGILQGSNGQLNPQGVATRAQVATIFMNADSILKSGIGKTETGDTNGNTNPAKENPSAVIVTDEKDKRPTGKSAVDQYGGYYDYDLANYIFDAVNDIRAENGLEKTAYSLKVAGWADIRSREVYQIGYADNQWGNPHVRPDGSKVETVGIGICGENADINSDNYQDVYKNEKGEEVIENNYTVNNHDGTVSTIKRIQTLEEFKATWGKSIALGWSSSDGHRKILLSKQAETSAVSVYIIDGHAYFIHLFDNKTVHVLNFN